MTPFSFGVYIVNLSMDLTYRAGNPSLLIRTLHHIAVDDAVLTSEEQIIRGKIDLHIAVDDAVLTSEEQIIRVKLICT
jgi:hypothetical protein